jgi:hypothetical protein
MAYTNVSNNCIYTFTQPALILPIIMIYIYGHSGSYRRITRPFFPHSEAPIQFIHSFTLQKCIANEGQNFQGNHIQTHLYLTR